MPSHCQVVEALLDPAEVTDAGRARLAANDRG